MEWHNMPIEVKGGTGQARMEKDVITPCWGDPFVKRSSGQGHQHGAMHTSKDMIFKRDQWLQSTDPKQKEPTGSVPAIKVGDHSRPTDDWPRQTAKREVLSGGEMESILAGHGPDKSPKSRISVVVCDQLTPIPTLGTCESQNSP